MALEYRIQVQEKWDSSHQLFLPYESKCNNLHGHRYEIEVQITGKTLQATGMLIDFTVVKSYLKPFDHQNLNDYFTPSTVENIATVLFWDLRDLLLQKAPTTVLEYVTVRESETTCCTVTVG